MDSATPDAPAPATVHEVADVVRTTLAGSYARPVVVTAGHEVAVLGGRPLELARAAVHARLGAPAAARVVALDASTLSWHAVPEGGLRLWRQHGREGADGEVVTELEHGDPPVQQVVDDDGWVLLRLADGSQGWVRDCADELEPCAAPPAALADASRVDPEAFVEEVLRFEGVPYVWGGTTDSGVDCSGLVQRAAWRAGRCWLPRHSRALLRAGSRVAPAALRRGDVLVLQRDPASWQPEELARLESLAAEQRRQGNVPAHGPAIHPMHVAVALSADEAVHASRDVMRVVREPLRSLRERYRVLGVRRLGGAAENGAAR